ncbi:MAG: energy transducer TonB [bacterium]
MVKAPIVWDRNEAYARDIRLASVAALGLVISAFLFLQLPEVRPYAASAGSTWVELDPQSVLVIEPPKPPEGVPPRPRDFVGDANGVQSDPNIGLTQERLDSLRVLFPMEDPLPKVPWAKVERKPVLVHQVSPEYPRLAREAGIEGTVTVTLVIDTLGLVESAEVLNSSGSSVLDSSALAAVRQMKFRPGYQMNRPVRVQGNMPFRFRLQ